MAQQELIKFPVVVKRSKNDRERALTIAATDEAKARAIAVTLIRRREKLGSNVQLFATVPK